MAMISDAQLAKVQQHVARQDTTIDKLRGQKAREKAAGIAFQVIEGAGAAAGVGYVRGKLESNGRAFALGPVDGEIVTAVLLIGAGAMPKFFGKYGEHLLNAGVGVLCHYAGQMGRAAGKGLPINSSVIGMLPEHVGMDPTYVGGRRIGAGVPSYAANDLAAALAASAAG